MVKKWIKIVATFLVSSGLLIIAITPALAATQTAPEYNVLNNILKVFQQQIFKYIAPLTSAAKNLFYYLIIIDLILAYILNFRNTDYFQLLVIKILKYGFVYWVIIDYREIINWIISGFIWIGVIGGSQATPGISLISDPTQFTNVAIRLAGGIFANTVLIAIPVLGNIYMFFGILIFLAIVSIAVHYLVTFLEFYTLAILSLALVPFGANKFTAWAAQKVGNVIFAFGVKIMILSFLAAVSIPILENWALPNFNVMDPGAFIPSMLYLTAGSLALMVLAWHAPSLAASLLGGMSSLHAGSVIAPVVNIAQTAQIVSGAVATGGTSLALQSAVGTLTQGPSAGGNSSAINNATKIA
jgi:type IV secretion system protein TrbL